MSETLGGHLRGRAAGQGEALALAFLDEAGEVADRRSYRGLDLRARAVAAALAGERGQRALLLYPPGLGYIDAFFGCLYAGVVAVPAYPPDPARLDRTLPRLLAIARDAGARLVLTTASIAGAARGLPALAGLGARWVATDEIDDREASGFGEPAGGPHDVAFLQYTSGSTGDPKGVMVSHRNLETNLEALERAEENGAEARALSWLPAYHDMGLIEGILHPLFRGYVGYLLAPSSFLLRPPLWLELIGKLGVTNSGGPNFAYDLCARKVTDASALDLSSWRVAYNGAEPIRHETIERFCQKFAASGFRRAAFYPVYGLAEATLLVSTGGPLDEPRSLPVSPRALLADRAEPACDEAPLRLVASGRPWGAEVAVVCPRRRERLPERSVGEIWVRGPGVARGYWGRPGLTRARFQARVEGERGDPWLRTGDLGFVDGGDLFVTGRRDDLLVVRGQNHYPQDIEHTAEGAAPVRPGCVAVFSFDLEKIGLAAEVDPGADLAAAARGLREAVAEAHGLGLDALVLLAPRSLPKTSSGKLRRSACRALLDPASPALLRWLAPPPASAPEAASTLDWLRASAAARLGLDFWQIDPQSSPFRLGLGSLDQIEWLAEAARRKGGRLHPGALLDRASLAEIAAHLDAAEPPHDPRHTAARPAYLDDLALPPDVRPRGAPGGEVVLLTGATGFLGAYLLRELLRRGRRVRCLVRGPGGEARLRAAMERVGVDPGHQGVEVAPGDIEAPGLGLDEAGREALVEGLGLVIHGAAWVSWVHPYEALRGANVLGTAELLRLACARSLPFHFVSTAAVCLGPGPQPSVDEGAATGLDRLHLGYALSKGVAEALVRLACLRGLPAAIHRPTFLTGDSETGAWNSGDFLSAVISGCARMGAFPDLDVDLDLCAVDEAARATAELALRPLAPGHIEIFHITSPGAKNLRELALWTRVVGHPARLLAYHPWLERLSAEATDPSHPLFYLRSFFGRPVEKDETMPELFERGRRPRLDSRKTRQALGPLGPRPLDVDRLGRHLSRFERDGLLPPAARRAPAPPGAARAALERLLPSLHQRHEILSVDPFRAGGGLLSELASLGGAGPAGLFRCRLRRQGAGPVELVLKLHASGDASVGVGQALAALCGERLGEAFDAARGELAAAGAYLREVAVYRQRDPRFVAHTPAVVALGGGAAGEPSALLIERLRGMELLDHTGAPWHPRQIDDAIDGLARLHAIWLGREAELSALPWPGPEGRPTPPLRALWRALADHAAPLFDPWYGPRGADLHRRLLDDEREPPAGPRTLIHNDFNPRNAGLRRGGRLCAYDWELAAVGLPQRDLAELLCFTLAPGVDPGEIDRLLERHRTALERESGQRLDRDEWRRGFSWSLGRLMVDRLPLYALAQRVRPQPFLERVVRAWAWLRGAARAEVQPGRHALSP